jgi:hypothetical protein
MSLPSAVRSYSSLTPADGLTAVSTRVRSIQQRARRTTWTWVLLNSPVETLLKTFSNILWNQKVHKSPPKVITWASSIQYISTYPTSLRSTLIISSRLHIFPSAFPNKNLILFLPLTVASCCVFIWFCMTPSIATKFQYIAYMQRIRCSKIVLQNCISHLRMARRGRNM